MLSWVLALAPVTLPRSPREACGGVSSRLTITTPAHQYDSRRSARPVSRESGISGYLRGAAPACRAQLARRRRVNGLLRGLRARRFVHRGYDLGTGLCAA